VANEHTVAGDLPGYWAGPEARGGEAAAIALGAPGTGHAPGAARIPAGLVELGPAVRAVARCVLGGSASQADIDDCAGEVFRRALEAAGAGRLAAGAPLRPWVLGIARNVSLDARRASRRAWARHDDPTPLEEVADDRPGADHTFELAERARRLRVALDAVPDEARRAVLLHAEGFGYREIADRLGRPLGTICTWIARTRRHLARTLLDLDQDSVRDDGLHLALGGRQADADARAPARDGGGSEEALADEPAARSRRR
jgi:RNA polymerase sigma-70 factor (ECF subfamily)